MSPQNLKLIIDSIVWAFKHTMRNIADTGLNILLELLDNMEKSNASNAFYQTYFLNLLQDLFYVLTDTFHKQGFKLQASLLLKMFNAVESGRISAPLWDATKIIDPSMTNQKFLRQYVANLLGSSFKNLTQQQVNDFVLGLFDLNKDLAHFKTHLRDFLVKIKEFGGGEDNRQLFLEEKEATEAQRKDEIAKREMAVPGMVGPHDPRRDNEMMD